MVVEIGVALLKTLTSFLFGNYLKAHYGSIDIENAPSWYGQEPKEAICVSVYQNGGLEKLDFVKSLSKKKLEKKVSNILNIVIYKDKNLKNLTPDEEEFLKQIIKDKKLSLFIDANIKFQNIEVDKKNRVFVRSCLDKEAFIKYENKRIKEIEKDVVNYKANKAFDELENSF